MNFVKLLAHEQIILRLYAQELKKAEMPHRTIFVLAQTVLEKYPALDMSQVPND